MAKVACDKGVPCGTCSSNSFVCKYSRVSGTIQPDSPQLPNIPPSEQEDTAADTRECQISPATQESTDTAYKVRIPFLLNFYRETNSCQDFYMALESGRPEPRQRCGPSTKPTEVVFMSSAFAQASLTEESYEGFPFFGFPGVDSWGQELFDGRVSETMAEPQLFCFRKCGEEIVKELSRTADNSGMSTEGARDSLYSAIEQGLFSVTNLVEYTQLYLQCLRRHCPIIDLPTSRISSVSSPLLLAMFLGGSILSYPRDTYHLAIECFDLAEECIFGLPIFKTGCKVSGAPESRMPDLAEPLMAAIIMVNLQVGRNDPGIRRRIRRQRFPSLVYAARSLSLFQIAHQNTSLQPVLNGLTFTEKESLIRY
ncbi:hypothetical protein N8T08_006193 [Aspergillus melleus]|uniref:Uncharacterized protein n=1 Tax=Aspergillus melleus TaxID=138277 RepID=A0ACC3AZX5_9EURO|nr:hypothetical protein N8T08_006193 [Aspergillus melleus]